MLREQLEYLERDMVGRAGALEKPVEISSWDDVIVRYGPGLPARVLQPQTSGTTTEVSSPAEIFHNRFYG